MPMKGGKAVKGKCKCANCHKLQRVRERVLACCNPPFSHADQGVVDVWNDAVRDYPCLAPESEE